MIGEEFYESNLYKPSPAFIYNANYMCMYRWIFDE